MCTKGSGWPKTNKDDGPVKMRIRTVNKMYLGGNCVPYFRRFETGDRFKEVWGMFTTDSSKERRFFILPPNSEQAYMLLRGDFEILFDASLFFKITNRPNKKNINAFWNHAHLTDHEELAAFADLFLKSDWPPKKRHFVLNLMSRLEKTYEQNA